MFRSVKISTALFICLTFAFRLLFVNIGIASFLNPQQNKGSMKSHFSTVMKRRKHFESLNNVKNSNYSTVEICEESTDDGNQLNPFFLIQSLYSRFVGEIKNNFKALAFYRYFSHNSSCRYLVLQVIRI